MNDSRAFELQPTLSGEHLKLRPLEAEDFDAIYSVASDPLIWAMYPEPNRHKRPVFDKFFAEALRSNGALVVIDRISGQVIGSSRFYDLDPARREIAIGYTFLSCAYWGGLFNREMKALMLNHAFRFVDAVVFHVGEANIRSRRAMEKIGGRLSGIFEKKGTDGHKSRRVIYRIEKKTWNSGTHA